MIVCFSDPYLTHVAWIDDDDVNVVWSNRLQNYSLITVCSRKDDWKCKIVSFKMYLIVWLHFGKALTSKRRDIIMIINDHVSI